MNIMMATPASCRAFQKALTMASKLAGGLLAVLLLYILFRDCYPLFHTLIEGFSILVAVLLYILATRTYRYSGDGLLLFLGNAYLFIAVIALFHASFYQGTGPAAGYGGNTAAQLWIAEGYLTGLSFLLAAVFARRRLASGLQFWSYLVVTGLLLFSIVCLHRFPDCCIDGRGLTVFGIASEYLTALGILVAMLLFMRQRSHLDNALYRILMATMACTVLSESAFALTVDIRSGMNFIGHVFKAAFYALIYAGVVLRSLDRPYETIFQELKASSVTDNLTGLYNRQGFREVIRGELFLAQQRGLPLGLLMLDIDNFKSVNDNFGHLAGDQVLKDFARLFQSSLRERDIACRLGGDEFLAIVRAGRSGLSMVERRIRTAFQAWAAAGETTRELGLSIGGMVWEPGMPPDVENLILEADRGLYGEKEAKSKTTNKQTVPAVPVDKATGGD